MGSRGHFGVMGTLLNAEQGHFLPIPSELDIL